MRRQGIFWICTFPHHAFTPFLPANVAWIKGQLELGAGGFLHWQVLVAFTSKRSLAQVVGLFGPYHCELSRSEAASIYVWKESTRIEGTQFELGSKPIRLNSSTDWEEVWRNAQGGLLSTIPAFVRVKSYRTLRAIASDYDRPRAMERSCKVFFGPTATGKSRRAWEEAGVDAFIKSSRTKYWCGYQGEENVIIDEFRGDIDITYLLLWLDRYPVRVEIKGSTRCLCARRFWICSNLHPRGSLLSNVDWFPLVDHLTYAALERRLEIIDFT